MSFEQPSWNKTPESQGENASEQLADRRKKPSVARLARNLIVAAALGAAGIGVFKLAERPTEHGTGIEQAEISKERALTAEEAERLAANRAYIEKNIGPHTLRYLEAMHEINRRLNLEQEPRYEGFEKIGVNPELLKTLWKDGQTYPKGWIVGEVERLKVLDPKNSPRPVYGPDGDQWYGGTATQGSQGMSQITFSGFEAHERKDVVPSLDWYFGHEISHLNDWAYDRDAAFADRVNLLARTHERMNAPDHFENPLGGYGDMAEIEDPEQREYYKTREYWGELNEYYFAFPDMLKEKSPKDFELVDQWVKRSDPEFDTFRAHALRDSIIENAAVQTSEQE